MQLSDPHFGSERPQVVAELRRLVHHINPSALVLSGDITQRARADQFQQAREFVASLGARPLVAIPGNHDIPLFNVPARLFWPYAGFQHAFGACLEPVIDADDWMVVGVNTTRRWRHKHGELSHQQVEAVCARLKRARPGQVRVVVTHQPVAVPRASEVNNLVRGARQVAVREWAQCGADLVLSGHIHLPAAMALHVHDGGWGPLARPLWGVLAGSALSRRLRHDAGNSVNVFRRARSPEAGEQDAAALHLERWDFVDRRFELAHVEHLCLGRAHGH